jgi:hypothetical protein
MTLRECPERYLKEHAIEDISLDENQIVKVRWNDL